MKNKEIKAAVLMAAWFLILPGGVLTRPQEICTLIIFYAVAWSALSWIEDRIKPKKKRKVCKKPKPREEYQLWERYADGTYHKVPGPTL